MFHQLCTWQASLFGLAFAQHSSNVNWIFLQEVNILFLPLLFQAGYIRIDGSVPSSERIQLVNKFQSDPETRVAILSIQAAGQVLTHTNTWIVYDTDLWYLFILVML